MSQRIRDDLDDGEVLVGLTKIRRVIESLGLIDPDEDEMRYLATYHQMQDSYAAILTEARVRQLSIPTWEGDDLLFSPLVNRWISLEEHGA